MFQRCGITSILWRSMNIGPRGVCFSSEPSSMYIFLKMLLINYRLFWRTLNLKILALSIIWFSYDLLLDNLSFNLIFNLSRRPLLNNYLALLNLERDSQFLLFLSDLRIVGIMIQVLLWALLTIVNEWMWKILIFDLRCYHIYFKLTT
jgi:hypothetical protein